MTERHSKNILNYELIRNAHSKNFKINMAVNFKT